MHPATGLIWAALTLLAIAGAPKVAKPFDLQRALRMAGLRVRHPVVRAFGALETAVGVLGLLTGNPVLLAWAALSYLGFAVFVGYALTRSTPLSSCGCFGKADSPPTRTHVVVVAVFAVALTIGALTGAPGLVSAVTTAGFGVTLLTAGFTAIVAWFSYLVMGLLPTAMARPNSPAPTGGTA